MNNSNTILIDRPPRIQPELPFDEIEIPPPPEKEENGFTQLIQMSLPVITIIGYVLISAFGGRGRSPWLIIPMALSVVGSTVFAIYSYFKNKQRRAEIERAYSDRLIEMNKEMAGYHDMQRRFYSYNYPDQGTLMRLVKLARIEATKPRAERELRSVARLWERRASDEDFGWLRLGMGTLPSTVTYVLSEVENFEDPQVREALKLQSDSQFVSDIPVVISLRQPIQDKKEDGDEDEEGNGRTPTTHALGIAGERTAVYKFTRALLSDYVVFHAAMDAKLYVLAPQKQEWEWTEALPHTQKDETNEYLCFVDQIQEDKNEQKFDEDDEGPINQFLEGIRKVLSQRKIRLQDKEGEENEEKDDPTHPFLLIVIDLLDVIYDTQSPLSDLEADAAISILLEEGASLGAAVIFLVPERAKIPSKCHSVIEIQYTSPVTNSQDNQTDILHYRYAETGINSTRYVGVADYVSTTQAMEELTQRLAQLEIRQGFGAGLTSVVPFLELVGPFNSLDELAQATFENWTQSVKQDNANWLKAAIGKMSGNKSRKLTFSAKRDGVHGMVAGSTGSGKSELLISMIMAMAVTYDPSVLNFVLVDYKGGGAFSEFAKLPHCVDIITNLEGDGVTRMFTAIRSEMQRRQKLNADTETKNIVEYRQKGLHTKHKPYPYLFIIIDEFAEMIADRAEYKAELESITRVGRAQGVSLILAAQRPSGVTDQMRSNIKFRICLRVETPGESREMLRRNDAAYLPSNIPGRGYLQIGNEEIELIQVAYSGDKYIDPNRSPRRKVIWEGRGENYDENQDREPPELYKAIIGRLEELSQTYEIPKQRAPWPDFLPRQLSLSELLISNNSKVHTITSETYLTEIDKIMLGRQPDDTLTLNPSVNKWINGENGWIESDLDWEMYAMRPVVGLVDNPYAASQLPLTIDLQRGHVVIFGASGWGKTTFVRSLVTSLAATHSPNHLNMYILDLGGRNLGVLDHLPHVGAVITPDEEGYKERVEQLLREIDDLIEVRKTMFGNVGASDLYDFNQSHPDVAIPAILVAIDNFVEFRETFDNGNDNVESVLDKFITLARQSKPYGIHFVVTANQLSTLSSQLYSLFTERLTLKLAEASDYRAVVGGQVPDLPEVPGRGYIKIGQQILTFQIAIPIDLRREELEESANEVQELEQFAQNMNEYIAQHSQQYKEPIQVRALPKAVLFKQLLAQQMAVDVDSRFLINLENHARKKWLNSIEQADWLQVTLGVISGNRPRKMYFEAKRDGVHGLIAGGTGSGKSEMLMTLIVGLALNYDPSILNFVLVDYKGGGAFKPFDKLPHCVDSITNLNKAAVRRMFTAINAEMQRRQQLNAETGTKDIVEYRAKKYHLTREPYPHLFIIIDEYAEMITDSPEFKDELDSITRVGRAQGVNLLLAAQRPTGVTDQMRANIKYRVCLRVEGVDTSREMLRRSDAAFLPSGMPGRGYLQIGNENIELIQIAYTGESFSYEDSSEGDKQAKFYDVVVDLTRKLAQGELPQTPWPPFLPTQLSLADYLHKDYFTADDKSLITLNKTESLQLNPFIYQWLNDQPAWYGINWRYTAMRAIIGLVDDPFNALQRPLIVDVTKGHVVLFGASGWGKTTFIRTLIISLAATHSPAEYHAHVLDLGGRNLEVLKALPHVGSVIMPDERGYEERVQELLRELNDIVDERKRLFSEAGVSTLYEYNNSDPAHIEPAILIAIDNFTEFMETFGDTSQKDSEDNLLEAFILLIRQAKAYGVHFIITVERLNVLSSKLYSLFTERFTLRLSNTGDYRAIVGGNVAEIDEIAGRGYVKIGRQPLEFQVAVAIGRFDDQGQIKNEAQGIRELGEKMNRLGADLWDDKRKPLRIEALPKTSSYRQVLSDVFDIDHDKAFLSALKSATKHQWHETALASKADWLSVVMGITSGSRKRRLHFSAKTDGVHGMIAGGTGSGKSELLMTMIVGLALNYDPSILNFVLVDYKGGGAFAPFRKLPHCVDIVTNLNKAAVNRMFTAIEAEIRRRQKLNADTGTKDIIEYREKNLHKTREPYPHLFVIIDEYAEMIDDNPEYKAALESITRVGRAQGINLILASQRPKGVTDQMRANIKLRMCLRVEGVDTSREMLRRPDAAFLPNGLPGRGYIQVGNENLELIQMSYTGESQRDDREIPVEWEDRPQNEGQLNEDIPKLYDAVVMITSELTNGVMAPKPWPAFLPTQFSLQSRLEDAQKNETFALSTAVNDWLNDDTDYLWAGVDWKEALRPVVGILDDPHEAKQEILRFDLGRSHLAIMGDAGWGKTSLMRTIMVSLTTTHTPNELHLYILDLGGRNFRNLEQLPHLGTIINSDEEEYEERLLRLMLRLEKTIEERQQILSNANATHLREYNANNPDSILPAIVVFIDNFAELRENYEGLVETTLMPMVRRSLNVGVAFVITANVPANIPSKLYNLFGERITFKQANRDRYMDIVGRGAIEIDEIAGRGYIRKGRRPLLFQAAQPVGIFDPTTGHDPLSEANELQQLAHNMEQYAQTLPQWDNKPDPINTLPKLVPLRHILEQGQTNTNRIRATLGQDGSLQTALIDLKQMGPHFVITGPPLSGKTTTLYNWIISLTHQYSPQQIMLVLIDLQGRLMDYNGQHRLGSLPHVVKAMGEIEELPSLVNNLQRECKRLEEQENEGRIFVIIDNFDDLADEFASTRDNQIRDAAKNLTRIARRYGTRGIHFVAAGNFSVASDLGRTLLGSNYGVGLRTGEALNTLRVPKVPSNLRDKELAIGRGYIAKAGQLTMVQVATPYQDDWTALDVEEPTRDDNFMSVALDKWVKEVVAKYPEQATWTTAPPDGEQDGVEGQVNKQNQRMLGWLQKALQQEVETLKEPEDFNNSVSAQWLKVDVSQWYEESTLSDFFKKIWCRDHNMSEEMFDGLGMSTDDCVQYVKNTYGSDPAQS